MKKALIVVFHVRRIAMEKSVFKRQIAGVEFVVPRKHAQVDTDTSKLLNI